MAHDFINFLPEKIMTIHNGFPSTSPSTDISSAEESRSSVMDTFDPLSASGIKQLQKKFSIALKECQEIFIGVIAKIVNTSVSLGLFPLSMKATVVKPITNITGQHQNCPTRLRSLKEQLLSN